MRKLLKSRKALSPVVAAIILIAVTVAVSIAVAAWMGALTFTFMTTEELQVQGCTFDAGPPKKIKMTVQNTGTADLTISKFKIGTTTKKLEEAGSAPVLVLQGETGTVEFEYDWSAGYTYDIYLISATGKQFPYRAVAP